MMRNDTGGQMGTVASALVRLSAASGRQHVDEAKAIGEIGLAKAVKSWRRTSFKTRRQELSGAPGKK